MTLFGSCDVKSKYVAMTLFWGRDVRIVTEDRVDKCFLVQVRFWKLIVRACVCVRVRVFECACACSSVRARFWHPKFILRACVCVWPPPPVVHSTYFPWIPFSLDARLSLCFFLSGHLTGHDCVSGFPVCVG